MSLSWTRRISAGLIAGSLTAGACAALAPAPAANAEAVNPQADAAAGWLADQLNENGVFTSGFDAIGSTVDFGLSLLETDPDSATLTRLIDGVEGELATYVGTAESPNAGKVAKAAAFFQATGIDLATEDVAGVDLLERLEAVVGEDGMLGDFEDTYGQAFAVMALDRADSAEADAATDALIGFRCDGAGWGYADWQTGDCVSAVDGTAYTLLALLDQAGDPDVDEAIDAAVSWLLDQQHADGGFGDWGVNNNGTTSEANGTGLAAWALGEAGETDAAQAAALWIADHQIATPAGCAAPVPGEEGALAYQDLDIESAITNGITDADAGTWIFAGAQALAALAHLTEAPAATATLSGPTGYVHAGRAIELTAEGLRGGQQACITGGAAPVWAVGSQAVTATLPKGTATRTLTLNHADATATARIKALGATRLAVNAPRRVEATSKARIKVTGLAPRESVTVRFGKRKATGTASRKGAIVVRIKAPRATGKAAVKAVGAFRDRKGATKVRITR